MDLIKKVKSIGLTFALNFENKIMGNRKLRL